MQKNNTMARFLLLLVSTAAALFSGCQPEKKTEVDYITLEGDAMGTYYRVTYADSLQRDFTPEIEAFLLDLNREASTYLDTSIISRFNATPALDVVLPVNARHFLTNFVKSREVFGASDGAFDPTVMPLVSYWGFGVKPKKVDRIDSLKVDSLRRMVGLDKIRMIPVGKDSVLLQKAVRGVQLDFNAIAQGYGVDEVGRILESKGVSAYLVDIGGEVVARGLNPRGQPWTIGINTPSETGQTDEIFTTVPLIDRALATSGNYRKFYQVEGVKFSHTINPHTGYPERNALLSASVFAPDAMTADAYATACMVLGPEKGMAMIERMENLEAYFIIGEPNGTMSVKYSRGLERLFPNKK